MERGSLWGPPASNVTLGLGPALRHTLTPGSGLVSSLGVLCSLPGSKCGKL